MKNKKSLIIIIAVVLVIVLALLLGLFMNKESSKLKTNAEKTEISTDTTGYRLDLRIFGTYNKTKINEIVMVNNYKNSDKQVNFTKVSDGKETTREFLVKDGKYYEVKDNKLSSVENILYEDTDIFLKGVKNMTDTEFSSTEKIGETSYDVYKGVVSKSIVNDMLEETDLGFKIDKDATCEVWITADGYVYKAYYKVDDLTIYPSYFRYNTINEINLDMYK